MGLQTIEFGGVAVSLQSNRTAWIPEHAALLAADLHLGKDATFRQAGIPVPAGATQRTLDRLAAAIAEVEARTCYVLGDFVHAANSLTDEVFSNVHDWLSAHRQVTDFILVRGNHDRTSMKRLAALPFYDVVSESRLDRLRLLHHPVEADAEDRGDLTIVGHVHPCFRLPAERGRHANVPCFFVQQQQMIMPAFGEFTGNFAVQPHRGEAAYLICDDELIVVRGAAAARSGAAFR